MTKEKSLSQQICELCGIESRCINCGQTVSNENPCKMPCNKHKLLNFENPENFVKLLKIANDILGKVEFTTAYTQNKKGIFEKQALQHYLLQATLNKDFKQSIRDYDGWVWG